MTGCSSEERLPRSGPGNHGDSAPQWTGNDHKGSGDMVLGYSKKVVYKNVAIVALGLVSVVAIVAIAMGIEGVSNRQQPDPTTSVTGHQTSSTSDMATSVFSTPSSSATAATSTDTTPSMITPGPQSLKPQSLKSCELGCYQDFVKTSGCVENCPGAYCLDNTGCMDPYPCIYNTCCYTGCMSGWACNGECSTTLNCVSATTGPAPMTCQP